jgi:hypothetical protein
VVAGVLIPLSMLPETVQVEPRTGTGKKGTATYGAAVAVRCRFEARQRRIRRPEGGLDLAAGVLYARPGAPIKDGDRVTRDGIAYRVVQAREHRDERRAAMLEVTLGTESLA